MIFKKIAIFSAVCTALTTLPLLAATEPRYITIHVTQEDVATAPAKSQEPFFNDDFWNGFTLTLVGQTFGHLAKKDDILSVLAFVVNIRRLYEMCTSKRFFSYAHGTLWGAVIASAVYK